MTTTTMEPAELSGHPARDGRDRPKRRALRLGHRASASLLLIVTLVVLLPVILMVINSVRTSGDIGARPIGLPHPLALGNYGDIATRMGYVRSLLNTLIIAAGSIVLVIAAGAPAAWVLARRVRRWTRAAYRLFVAGLTVPVFVVTTPLYLLMQQLGILDTYFAAILIYASFNLPFAVFFYVSFLRSSPQELEEAAALDGCGPLATFWHVVFQLLRPATATIVIFVSLAIWNDVVVPLLFLTDDNLKTVTLSVYSFVGSQGTVSSAELFPAVVLASAPLIVIFLVLQRHIIAWITAGMGKR